MLIKRQVGNKVTHYTSSSPFLDSFLSPFSSFLSFYFICLLLFQIFVMCSYYLWVFNTFSFVLWLSTGKKDNKKGNPCYCIQIHNESDKKRIKRCYPLEIFLTFEAHDYIFTSFSIFYFREFILLIGSEYLMLKHDFSLCVHGVKGQKMCFTNAFVISGLCLAITRFLLHHQSV